MKIRTKILYSLIAIVMVIVLAYLVFLAIKADRDDLLFQSYQEQQDHSVSSALLLHEKNLLNLARDYSLWDEMTVFLKTGDSRWSESNLSNVPGIHHLHGLWVINTQRQFLFTSQDEFIRLENLGLTQPEFYHFLTKHKTCHFFALQDSVIFEFAAGTIHPTKDLSKQEDPAGYLLICHQVDSLYIQELQHLTGCRISFTRDHSIQVPAPHDDSEIITGVSLLTWEKRFIGCLKFTHHQTLLQSYLKITSLTNTSYLFLSLLILAIMGTALFFWISKPLKKLAESLALESSVPIKPLLAKKDEFGEIATMIDRFFSQKKELAEIIHEKNEALTSLSEAEGKNRAILDAIPDLLLKINLFGVITDFHIGQREHLPFSEDALMGKNLEEIFPAEIKPMIKEAMREINQTRKPQKLAFQMPILQDKVRFYEAGITTTAFGDYLVVIRNITLQKEAETALHHMLEKEAELNALKTQFITTVSHEFRTPLSAISNNIQLLQLYGEKWTEEKKSETFLHIQKAIQELITLLNGLSAIAKDQSGRLKINPTHFDLPDFCRELVRDAAVQIESGERIQMDLQTKLSKVCMDKDLLRHIFINLLSNALKFSPSGKTVLFRISDAAENHLQFTIEDQGIGIPKEESEMIFEPFYRGQKVINFPGSGLGLSIVKRCTDLHHGSLQIDSEQNLGTRVSVILPNLIIQTHEHEKNTDH